MNYKSGVKSKEKNRKSLIFFFPEAEKNNGIGSNLQILGLPIRSFSKALRRVGEMASTGEKNRKSLMSVFFSVVKIRKRKKKPPNFYCFSIMYFFF